MSGAVAKTGSQLAKSGGYLYTSLYSNEHKTNINENNKLLFHHRIC